MPRTEIMQDVDNDAVAQIVSDAKAEGALSVTVVDQGDGKSTITMVWPDAPVSNTAKTAISSGSSATITTVPTASSDVGSMDAIAKRLQCDVAAVRAVAAVESSGTYFWTIAGQQKPPIRLEAHIFGRLTNYQYNDSHPTISCTNWTPSLAATTFAGAYQQYAQASALNANAAMQACSWGAFQIMGDNWQSLGYPSVETMVDNMQTQAGQIDAFIRFIETQNNQLAPALRAHDWSTFARLYNGPANVNVYSSKMAAAYMSFSGS